MSYRWGPSDGKHLALLDGLPFILTSSQDRTVRDLVDTRNIRLVWIDALCINQKDVSERNDQIQLMKKIFGQARCVVIYLDYEVHENSAANRKFLTFNFDSKPEDFLGEDSYFWRQICDALHSEYFGRVWVQQEMSLAKRLALQCRRTPMPIRSLLNFYEVSIRLCHQNFQGNIEIDARSLLDGYPDLKFLEILRCAGNPSRGKRLDLIELLCDSGRLGCTDERDRMYGLMFLARDWQEGYLVADYSLTVPEVFREAMISYLQNYGSIAFLEIANYSYEDFGHIQDQTPSWVPDWRKPLLEIDAEVPDSRQKPEHPLTANVSGNILCTEGIKITQVGKYYGHILDDGNIFGDTLSKSIREFWAEFNDIVKSARHPTDRAARSRFLYWLLADRGRVSNFDSDDGSQDEDWDTFLSLFESFFNSTNTNSMSSSTLDDLRSTLRESSTHQNAKDSSILKVLNSIDVNQLKRLMPFIDEAGSIGLAPPYTQPGNELWLIPTCKYPIVLRSRNGRHTVLGNAWFDKEEIWGQVGGKGDCVTEGREFGNHKLEPLCLE